MRFLGYGEDALTLWAIQDRLPEILLGLDDKIEDALDVFFRPSFGRRSIGSTHSIVPGPQFGEFDAIIVSQNGVYLIEAKWTGSGEITESTVVLRSEQIRRHKVFKEYLRLWRQGAFESWAAFLKVTTSLSWAPDAGEEAAFAVAPSGSRLSSNLEFVLQACARGGELVQDVLLVIHPSGGARKLAPPKGFRCVEITSPPVVGNFVELRPPDA